MVKFGLGNEDVGKKNDPLGFDAGSI